jgi:hypothetical protein
MRFGRFLHHSRLYTFCLTFMLCWIDLFFFADAVYLSLAGEVRIFVIVITMLPYHALDNMCPAFLLDKV